jgi:hypothetical protein
MAEVENLIAWTLFGLTTGHRSAEIEYVPLDCIQVRPAR